MELLLCRAGMILSLLFTSKTSLDITASVTRAEVTPPVPLKISRMCHKQSRHTEIDVSETFDYDVGVGPVAQLVRAERS